MDSDGILHYTPMVGVATRFFDPLSVTRRDRLGALTVKRRGENTVRLDLNY
jgi:hypothetical protein